MLLLFGIILSILETKEGLKGNKKRVILFLLFTITVTLIYIYKDRLPSVMGIITKIKELLYE